ncbi:MAG: poly-beta-1,6-N-acetyl-D-glucosamine N-deacetylase PgaB [Deltaproteobacteria bacterium]
MSCFRSQKFIWPKATKRVFLIFFLLFIAHFSLFTVTHAQESRPFLTDKDQFNYAIFLYKQGHYPVAAREFGRVIEYFPGSPVTPQAQYMIGDAYLNASMYKEAKNQFEQFMKNFPANELKEKALLKFGIAKDRLREAALFSVPKLPIIKIPSASLHQEERAIRAVQVALFEGKDYKEVYSEIDGLKAAGIDTIILRVFHNKGDRFYPFIIKPKNRGAHPQDGSGVYFKTKESPVIEDILGAVLDMAHKKGLKVFAWMTTKYADYGLEDRKDLHCKEYDFHTKGIIPCRGLDLFNERAVYHLERLFSDLAEYPVDGVLFQDDLVLKHNEGFGPYAERMFEKDNGRRLAADELYSDVSENGPPGRGGYTAGYTDEFWRWAAWKNKRLLHVAKRIRAAVKNKRPDVKFAINMMYESVSNPPYAMAWLSQSLDEAVKLDFDYYAIMAYHRQMQGELKKEPYEIHGLIEKMANEAVRLVGEPKKVLMKLQTINWNTSQPLPEQEVIGLLKKLKEVDNISIAVAPYRRDFPFGELADRKKITQLLR